MSTGGKQSLYEFLKEKNGRTQMANFVSACAIIQCIVIGLTISRAAIEFNSYAIAVAVINAFSTAYVGLDLSCWQFTNSVSLLFVIICDSVCISANILICFVPGDVRVLSFFVLAFSFILHAMIISFLLSTIVRKVTSQDDQVGKHTTGLESTIDAMSKVAKDVGLLLELPMIREQMQLNGFSTSSNPALASGEDDGSVFA